MRSARNHRRCSADATGINNGSTQLVEVVKALGEYLTSPEGDVRVKGGYNGILNM